MALDAHRPGLAVDLSHGFGEFEALHFSRGRLTKKGLLPRSVHGVLAPFQFKQAQDIAPIEVANRV